VPGRDHQDAVGPTPAAQLGQDHADLEGLAQADRVGDQQPGPQVAQAQCLGHRPALVVERVEQHLVGDAQALLVQRDGRLAQHRLEPQPGAAVAGGVVEHQL